MRASFHEVLAGAAVVAAVVGAPILLHQRAAAAPGSVRVLALTGVKKDGVWTDEAVDGTNYWRTKFRPAAPVLRQDEEVLLRLASADVRHGFYAPELGIGPVSIDPGHVVEVRVTPRRTGEFPFYCTEVCGHCHYAMKGVIRVVGPDEPLPAAQGKHCPHADAAPAPQPPPGRTVERGAFLFRDKGCFQCHGEGGAGGVRNPNYLAGNVPQNNLLAEKMGLFEKGDADKAIELIRAGTDLDAVAQPPFRNWPRFLAQYRAVHALILDGNLAGRKDPASFAPPLHMPSWRYHLTEDDIDACIVYLISQYPWEEDG